MTEQEKTEQLNELKSLKADYYKNKDSQHLQDLLNHCKDLSAMHTATSKARNAIKVQEDKSHKIVDLTPSDRLSELDMAAGIDEIISYIERMIA